MDRYRGDPEGAARYALADSHGQRNGANPNGHHADANVHASQDTPGVGEGVDIYELSDLGNAERFIAQCGHYVRWCPTRKLFLIWDGKRWQWDESGAVLELAHKTARSIYREAEHAPDKGKQRALARFALASQNTTRINGMLAQARPYLAVKLDDLDADDYLFNCQNGTVNLKTGELKDHDPQDLITKISPASYEEGAEAPRFEKFLRETLVDKAVIDFMRRLVGYSLTGDTSERILAILWGGGKNGKSTLVELLTDLIGDYAKGTDVETILAKRYQGVGNDVAALKGARFVPTSEVEKGRRLAESKVKALTGRDTITARFLFCEPFSFRPAFKLWLSTNNKPEIMGTDDAIWDRIRLVPFTQRFVGKKQDKSLPAALRKELDGVLAWAVRGCLEWQREGLGEPEKVVKATENYRAEMDALAAFISDRCVVAPKAEVPATPLYKEFQRWCDENGEDPDEKKNQRRFGARLNERGFESFTITNGAWKSYKGWRGIGLRVDDPGPDDGNDGGKHGPNDGGKGQPSGQTVDNRQPGEFPIGKGDSPSSRTRVDDSGQKVQDFRLVQPRVREDLEKRSTSSTSSTVDEDEHLPRQAKPRRLTEEEAQEVQKLVSQGMSAKAARQEVLRKSRTT